MKRNILIACLGLGLAVFVAWSLGSGQDPPRLDKPTSAKSLQPAAPNRDLSRVSLLEKQAYLIAQRGVDWLQRVNRTDGRFIHGYLPALRTAMEGDQYLHQLEAALALARAGRFFREDKATAIAKQAILTLLLDTTVDAKTPDIRYTSAPSALVNRLSAAGLLVLAIYELPSPGKDLVDQVQQLGNFIKGQQHADGTLAESDADSRDAPLTEDAVLNSGPALAALMRSDPAAPAAWKIEAVRKARQVYLKWWTEKKSAGMIRWHAAAYADAYRATKDPALAEAVFAMNDWLCERQYQELDPRRPLWLGGFKAWTNDKERSEPPEVSAAAYLDSLVDGCRTARLAGDVRRHQRYRQAIERTVQFLTTLQYSDAGTQHFAEWYRPVLVGGFHRSHQEGDLRLDFTAGSVAALASYLKWSAEQPAD